MEDPIVQAAQLAFARRIKDSNDVSKNTINAGEIGKAWRGAVHKLDPDRFLMEALVSPDLDQRIDIIDSKTGCAYEFKVSGKNASLEFYKNVVKVIIWNQRREKKLSALVFITDEKDGRRSLDKPMPRAYIEYLAKEGIVVTIEYVRPGSQ